MPGVGSTKPFSVLVGQLECQIIQLIGFNGQYLPSAIGTNDEIEKQQDLLDDNNDVKPR